LHACGLLNGKKATTHWLSLDRLRDLKKVEVVEKRYIKDGNIISRILSILVPARSIIKGKPVLKCPILL
jgi:hypothetical protein